MRYFKDMTVKGSCLRNKQRDIIPYIVNYIILAYDRYMSIVNNKTYKSIKTCPPSQRLELLPPWQH